VLSTYRNQFRAPCPYYPGCGCDLSPFRGKQVQACGFDEVEDEIVNELSPRHPEATPMLIRRLAQEIVYKTLIEPLAEEMNLDHLRGDDYA
jgi:hypothetical protein